MPVYFSRYLWLSRKKKHDFFPLSFPLFRKPFRSNHSRSSQQRREGQHALLLLEQLAVTQPNPVFSRQVWLSAQLASKLLPPFVPRTTEGKRETKRTVDYVLAYFDLFQFRQLLTVEVVVCVCAHACIYIYIYIYLSCRQTSPLFILPPYHGWI